MEVYRNIDAKESSIFYGYKYMVSVLQHELKILMDS